MDEYRYSYQGQEKEDLTGQISFELREYDAQLMRFQNPDPYGQFISPYLAMGNNPVNMIDPNGGWAGWYIDPEGYLRFDKAVNSQKDMETKGIEGKYQGQEGKGFNPETGNDVFFFDDGTWIEVSNRLPEVLVASEGYNLIEQDYRRKLRFVKFLDGLVTGSGDEADIDGNQFTSENATGNNIAITSTKPHTDDYNSTFRYMNVDQMFGVSCGPAGRLKVSVYKNTKTKKFEKVVRAIRRIESKQAKYVTGVSGTVGAFGTGQKVGDLVNKVDGTAPALDPNRDTTIDMNVKVMNSNGDWQYSLTRDSTVKVKDLDKIKRNINEKY